MVRTSKNLPIRKSIAIIIDGQDEKWYIEKVREAYPCNKLREMKIEPSLPHKKKIKDLITLAKKKVDDGVQIVFLCIDLDEPLKNPKEYSTFCDLYKKYIDLKNGNETLSNKWMKQLIIIVNNPCLEYWFLLHFKETNKFYASYEPELKKDLRKCASMEQYEKNNNYFNKSPNIYDRLGKAEGIKKARHNAKKFELNKCRNSGSSEMFRLFEYFDDL